MNQLIIHRFNGIETFPIVTAKMFTVGKVNDLTLWFEIETTEQGAQPNSDTSNFPANPNAELGIKIAEFKLNNLAGMQLHYAGTDNDREDSCNALFYYYDHQPLRDNHIIISAQNSLNIFRVHWSARTQDVNYYDDNKPEARIDIEANFYYDNTRVKD
ncbi:hypothetical protein U2F10_28580 [Leptothoe sp. EHU-05/26/07-4]